MQRELSSFPMPPVHRMKLQNAGFVTVQDLRDVTPSELCKELSISKNEAVDIFKLVFPHGNSSQQDTSQCGSSVSLPRTTNRPSVSALDMLEDEESQQCITTFSSQLDQLLGDGVPLTKITEFCGAPGVGKTQTCLQLCIDVQIPEAMGGLGGEAVFIDTEGSFLVERLGEMAEAAVNHCAQIDIAEDEKVQMELFTVESILSGVHYFRCHDYVELIATVHLLPEFLREHPKVKLIVVDSIAFHFRHDFEDLSLRTRLLNGLAQSFIKAAKLNKLAVVLTNQMTTKIHVGHPNTSHLVPALGESWGHASTIRVILYWQSNVRHALLYKSPSKEEATVPYQITMGGVRDLKQNVREADVSTGPVNPHKKRKVDS